MRRGVVAAVIGLLLLTMFRLARSALGGPIAILVAVPAFAVGAWSQAQAAWIVIAAGIVGVLGRR